MKQEIQSLRQQNGDLSKKLNQSSAKSTQTTTKGDALTSEARSKVTGIDLHWDEEGNLAEMLEDKDPFV